MIHQLKRRQHTTWSIKIKSLSSQSLLTLLTDINECQVRSLYIWNTHFDSNCVNQLIQVAAYNKTIDVLYLSSSPLLPDTYHLLTTALSNNNILERLYLFNGNNISDKDIPYIYHLIATNTTLEFLFLYSPNMTKFVMQNVCVKNKSLDVCINGYRLC